MHRALSPCDDFELDLSELGAESEAVCAGAFQNYVGDVVMLEEDILADEAEVSLGSMSEEANFSELLNALLKMKPVVVSE